jgi:hypothetical protein
MSVGINFISAFRVFCVDVINRSYCSAISLGEASRNNDPFGSTHLLLDRINGVNTFQREVEVVSKISHEQWLLLTPLQFERDLQTCVSCARYRDGFEIIAQSHDRSIAIEFVLALQGGADEIASLQVIHSENAFQIPEDLILVEPKVRFATDNQ